MRDGEVLGDLAAEAEEEMMKARTWIVRNGRVVDVSIDPTS